MPDYLHVALSELSDFLETKGNADEARDKDGKWTSSGDKAAALAASKKMDEHIGKLLNHHAILAGRIRQDNVSAKDLKHHSETIGKHVDGAESYRNKINALRASNGLKPIPPHEAITPSIGMKYHLDTMEMNRQAVKDLTKTHNGGAVKPDGSPAFAD